MKQNKSKLTAEEILHLAKLSQLSLTDEEIKKIGNQLNETLNYVNNLNELDTSSISEEMHVTKTTNAMREDTVDTSRMFSQANALKNAANKKNGYFVVKRIL